MNISDINSNSRFFLQNIPDIDYGANEFLDIIVTVGGVVIFDERVFADNDGHVYLRDIPALLMPYFSEPYMYVNFGKGSSNVPVIYSRRYVNAFDPDVSTSFVNFVLHNFFVSANTSRVNMYDSFKIWFAMAPDETSVNCTAIVNYVKDGVMTSTPVSLGSVTNTDTGYFSIKSLTVNFASVLSSITADAVASYVTLMVGERMHTFIVSYKDADLKFSFKNNFGYLESASLFGSLKMSPSYSFVKANIRRVRFNVDAKETINYTFNTGALTVDDRTLIQDIFNTDVVSMIVDGKQYEVAMNEQSLGWDKSGKVMSYAEIGFERSANPGMAWVEAYDYRVFDDSFDKTFR